MSQENAALGCQWFEQVWNQQRLEAIDELADPACQAHGHAPDDEVIGLARFKEFARSVIEAFPDVNIQVEETISEGDRCVLRWVGRMTHRGEFMGIPATGKHLVVRGISILRFAGGKIVEAWDNWDQLGLLTKLGALPQVDVIPRAKAS